MSFINIIPWLFFISEVSIIVFKREKDKNIRESFGTRIAWIIAIICIAIGTYVGIQLNIGSKLINNIGLVMIVIGFIIRWLSIITLGDYFTVNLRIDEEHKIIKTGFYKYTRHPSYLGAFIAVLGIALFYFNWVSFMLITIPYLSVLLPRIKDEEKMLVEYFGDEYIEYQRATKILIPFIL
ncbi:methyltransferase family protein [Halonatronum saccharophilum]|uniref:methyltransferase family protein n=1 Tax=Halonatronum saccharophilum TaxID=150060 RepID=UPI0004B41038|nr:isoprenylcysteine carboxylmethyltransferase family protein [Halonatronum saccharophilum]